ncbi:MAG TPA: DUF4783 domain-containing protein [Ferruginibacter sp.]|jgi:hypothetical protein|nr:DUF4783 domain-containing protein [Ferruginibacter sp.]
MKRLYLLLTSVVLLSSYTLLSDIDNVVNALKNGDVAQIAKSFDDKVQLTMPDKTNSYTRAQAEIVLKTFFDAHPVTGFVIVHKGANDGSEYCIGTLQTKNGIFRTTVFMKQKGSVEVLQEMKIETIISV